MSDDTDDPVDTLATPEREVRAVGTPASLRRAERRAERLEAEVDSRDAQISALREQLDLVRSEGAKARAALEAGLRAATEAAQGNASERDAAAGERDRLAADLRRAGAEVERLERERAAATARAESEAAERVHAERRLEEAERRGTELDAALTTLGREHAEAEDAARVMRSEQRARIRELEQLNSTLSGALRSVGRDVQRAEQSHAWRFGHSMTRAANRLRRRDTRTEGALRTAMQRITELGLAPPGLPDGERLALPPGPLPDDPEEPAPEREDAEILAQREALAAEIRRRLGPVPEPGHWPAVSIVVPSRDGREHLERLIAGLRWDTDYPVAELVVVDNGSGDGTAEWLETCDAGMPIRVVRNEENRSFSESVGQGVAAAAGVLVLLLNNDVEPFESGWLRELVAAHLLGGQSLTGATLLHTEDKSARAANGQLVQHRGIRLRAEQGIVRPYNDGDGDSLFGDGFGIEQVAAAASGACLLADRSTFESRGALSPRYRYGQEDVDLGLRLAGAGLETVVTGRSMVYHAQSATRFAQGNDFTRVTREANRHTLLERWGPEMQRRYRRARLGGDQVWTDGRGPHAVVVLTSVAESDGWGDWHTARGLGDALARRNWRITYVDYDNWAPLPHDADYVVTLLDRFDARGVPADVPVVAWIRNWTDRWLERPWFARLDVLLASSQGSAELIEARTGRRPFVFPLATDARRFGAASPDPLRSVDTVFVGNRWGEERAIESALVPPRGQSVAIHGRNWDKIRALSRFSQGPASSEELPAIYASARVALDDTQSPTLRYGAVNARVFDALATGTPVLTNCVEGVRELFDDDFPVWRTPEDLGGERDRLLDDDQRRSALAARYREMVLTRHTFEHRADELVGILRERVELPSFCIKIGAPDWEQAQRWGDLHFARGIERELRRRGHRCLVQVLDEWDDPEGLTFDVVLHLKGLSRFHSKPGQRNVLWCISHPNELTGEECDGYDLVCVASESFAESIRSRTSTEVMVLEQATDPHRFYPDPYSDESAHHDLVYVANSRNVLRPMMRDLLPTDLDLAVYGGNWTGLIDSKYVVAEHVPNGDLRHVYSSAKIVLADHWDDMREHGFVSNRIYDALACGACVVSDEVAGLADRFGGSVATYSGPDELRPLLDRLLADPDERAARGERGRASVLGGEVFSRRVEALLGGLPAESVGERPTASLTSP
jgi:GT2 family glycosyltransferase/spore maturation protein CgeB